MAWTTCPPSRQPPFFLPGMGTQNDFQSVSQNEIRDYNLAGCVCSNVASRIALKTPAQPQRLHLLLYSLIRMVKHS